MSPYRISAPPVEVSHRPSRFMRVIDKLYETGALWPAVCGTALLLSGTIGAACTPAQKQDAKTALDVLQVACIIAHQALPDGTDTPEATIAAVCGIANDFIGPMETILSSSRRASAQAVTAAHVGACGPAREPTDAGAKK